MCALQKSRNTNFIAFVMIRSTLNQQFSALKTSTFTLTVEYLSKKDEHIYINRESIYQRRKSTFTLTGEYLSKKDKHIYINRRVFIKEGRAHLH
jgi:hypothetical protein